MFALARDGGGWIVKMQVFRTALEFDRPRLPEDLNGYKGQPLRCCWTRMTSRGTGKMTDHIIGIDVSKETLDIFFLPESKQQKLSNDAQGLKRLLPFVFPDDTHVIFEPTGQYHKGLEAWLKHENITYTKVNPRQARRFAEAIGTQAKTDAVDARLLAKYGQTLEPTPTLPADEEILTLKDLHVARTALIKDRTAVRNRLHVARILLVQKQLKQRLAQIETHLKAITDLMKDIISSHAHLKQRYDILLSIPGLGDSSTLAMLCEMPELGALKSKQVASLAGLAPMSRQSGHWTGKACIKGGRRNVRQALYMPALVACRYNPDFKRKYEQLVQAGKPKKVAITAIMRKLILLANTLIKQDRKWVENPT